jgi:hypothetical protein
LAKYANSIVIGQRPCNDLETPPDVHNLNRVAVELHQFCVLCLGLSGSRVGVWDLRSWAVSSVPERIGLCSALDLRQSWLGKPATGTGVSEFPQANGGV